MCRMSREVEDRQTPEFKNQVQTFQLLGHASRTLFQVKCETIALLVSNPNAC